MVMLPSDRVPGAELVIGCVRECFPDVRVTLADTDGAFASYEVEGCRVMAMHMPLPIPVDEVAVAAKRSWMWDEAEAKVGGQRSHVLVTAVDSEPSSGSVGVARAVSYVAAAVCRAADGIGVYWGEGGHVLEGEMFVECVREEELPVPVWVGVIVSEDTGGTHTLTTCGLEAFGHRELEIMRTTMSAMNLAETAWGVVAYLLDNGPVLKHGHTFGPTAEDKWRVEFGKSSFNKGQKVLRLHVP